MRSLDELKAMRPVILYWPNKSKMSHDSHVENVNDAFDTLLAEIAERDVELEVLNERVARLKKERND